MTDRTCTIDGCPGKHEAKGYCSKHYQRYRKGQPVEGPQPRGCTAPGCSEKHKASGYCQVHYGRLRRTGSIEPPPPPSCLIEDCSGEYKAKGYCSFHYERHRAARDLVAPFYGTAGPLKYSTAHGMVRRKRGPAKDQICADCGCRAQEWSYDGNGGADERRGTSSKGYPAVYSVNPDHYSPRCVPCHRAYDRKKGAA